MNLKEYYTNPMGKGSSALINRGGIVSELLSQYNDLISTKKIKVVVYRVSSKEYLLHLKVPTISDRGNDYDVVIQFYTDDKDIIRQGSIKDYNVRLFSNAPSFVYTFAHAYRENDMLVTQLFGKFDKQVFKKQPEMRNPYKIVSYEKYVFFAVRYILEDVRYMNKDILDKMSKTYLEPLFKKSIRTDDEVLLEIKKLNHKLKEKRKKEKQEDRNVKGGKVEKKETKSTVNTIRPKTKTTVRTIKPMKKLKKR